MPTNVIEPSQTETVKPIRVARPCTRAQLEPRLYLQPATSKLVGQVTLQVTGPRRCSVFPFSPRVSFSGTSQRVKAYEMPPADPRQRGARPPWSLRPGDKVAIDLEWGNWCSSPPKALVIEIRFSGVYRLRTHDSPKCLSEDLPSSIGVGPVVPIR